jgi:transcription termination/antitermination protein NusA
MVVIENSTQQFIRQLAERESVPEEKIKEIIADSFRKSYCQGENKDADLHFEFASDLAAYRVYKLVENVTDLEKEIALDSKLLKKGEIRDNKFFLPLDVKKLFFSFNYEMKKVWERELRSTKQERQLESFKTLQGEIIQGIVQRKEENYYLVNLGKVLGYWAREEWKITTVPIGKRLCFLVKEIQESRLILTREDNLFLRKVLENVIPQIKYGDIIIRHILRLPGLISKVIVESQKPGLNAKGTCIGEEAIRIRSISSLIYPERIDIAIWSEKKKELLFELLSPVKIIRLIEKEKDNWEIIIRREKAALLLQHQGRLLKKISEYLEKKIHVRILEEMEEKGEKLENKGETVKEITNYKNVQVRILEEMEEI